MNRGTGGYNRKPDSQEEFEVVRNRGYVSFIKGDETDRASSRLLTGLVTLSL